MKTGPQKGDIFFLVVGVMMLSAWVMIPFASGWYHPIDASVGMIALIIAIYSFFMIYRLYDFKSSEKWVWLLFLLSILTLFLAGGVMGALRLSTAYFFTRLISIALMTIALVLKLQFAGVDLNASQKTVALITMIGWFLVVALSTVIADIHLDVGGVSRSSIFAFAEIIGLILAVIIIQTIKAKGWYIIGVGILLKSMGDILEPLTELLETSNPGYPTRILWYLGLLIVACGAYYLRRDMLSMMEI